MRIDLSPLAMEHQKPTEVKKCYLCLEEKYIRYVVTMFADEPVDIEDLGLGWESKYNSMDSVALKKDIVGIQKWWLGDTSRWGVYVIVNGFPDDMRIFFDRQTEARELYERLLKYLTEL